MQTKYFVLAAAMVCAVSMVANNKVSGVIKDAADKSALIGVNVSLKQGERQEPATHYLWCYRGRSGQTDSP